MTTTSTFSGKCDGRNSSRVLRPPGGGSSDIFGASPAPEQPLPKPSKRHDSNNIFGTPTSAGDTSGKVNERITKSNVFGPAEPAPEPSKPRKQDANSDIFGPPKEAKASGKKVQDGEDSDSDSDSESEGDKKENVSPPATVEVKTATSTAAAPIKRVVINPITGEVVVPAGGVGDCNDNVEKSIAPESPITSANNKPEQPFHPSTRVRQPPGGASSKLW